MHFALVFALASLPLGVASELVVPVTLWDSRGTNATQSGLPPRYVIGRISIGGQSQHFTFDAGNPKEPILVAEGCAGCSTGCPSTVPTCSSSSTQCWPSHPHDYAPAGSYTVTHASCPDGVTSAGTLDGVPVCMQCFGGGSHSRFYTMVQADVNIAGFTLKSLAFGALVRTAPAIDRVWSNVGVGYNSHFLQQVGSPSIFFHLRPDSQSQVIFNPSRERYADFPKTSFTVQTSRVHSVDKVYTVRKVVTITSTAVWHMDTGNEGISIESSSDLSALQSLAQGLTPKTAPDLTIVLNGIPVTLPGSTWVTGSGKTVFSSYHKNVLGLPFFSAADIVFDDSSKTIYIGGASPSPSPSPSPPPSPPPASCVDTCKNASTLCDCECFCSCGAVCGDGCYGRCKTVQRSCSGNCVGFAWSSSNASLLV